MSRFTDPTKLDPQADEPNQTPHITNKKETGPTHPLRPDL